MYKCLNVWFFSFSSHSITTGLLWLWNPWGGSPKVQNKGNQWLHKMNLSPTKWNGTCFGENFNINVQNWLKRIKQDYAKLGFELKGHFNMGCQWTVICVKVWIKHDCMKFGFELKGQFNMGHQWWQVLSGMMVRIIQSVQISEGQIIWAILYFTQKQTLKKL